MKITCCPVYTMLPKEEAEVYVVIDTLRMTSSAVTAIANGCAAIRMVDTVEKALEYRAREGALLGGERKALKIDGFDFSNSPLDFVREKVAGQSLVLTTTNGTNAVLSVRNPKSLRLCALANVSAVAASLADAESVCFVLAGTNGGFSLEDALTAGAVIERLGECEADDLSHAARLLYRAHSHDLMNAVKDIAHVKRLMGLGFARDVAYCLTEDSCDCVPMLCADGRFRAM